jgi:hypothetical protein
MNRTILSPFARFVLAAITLFFSFVLEAAVFVVDSTSALSNSFYQACTSAPDDCSLIGALTRAEATTAEDTINFNIPAATDSGCVAATGVCTITVFQAIFLNPLIIDGLTQPGAAPNTLPANGSGVNFDLKIQIKLNSGYFGGPLVMRGIAFNPTFINLYRVEPGEQVVRFENSILGGFADGTPTPTSGSTGIQIQNCSPFTFNSTEGTLRTFLGGTAPAQRNLIFTEIAFRKCAPQYLSGLAYVTIQGNLFGTTKDGLQVASRPPASGELRAPGSIIVPGATATFDTQIGGADPNARNVFAVSTTTKISTYAGDGGVYPLARVQGNYFGVGVDGTTPIYQGDLQGIGIISMYGAQIGGTTAGDGNLFFGALTYTYNNSNVGWLNLFGLNLVLGNQFKFSLPQFPPPLAAPSSVIGSSNTLTADRVNDPGDSDGGGAAGVGNPLQNYPEITAYAIAGNQLQLSYKVDSATANSTYPLTVEFYRASRQNTGIPEQYLLRDVYTAADAQQVKNLNITLPTGHGLLSTDMIVGIANQTNGGVSMFSWSPTLLTFVGNNPALADRFTAITVNARTTGPFRPQGKVDLTVVSSFGGPPVSVCTVTLLPSATNPFAAQGSCNILVPASQATATLRIDAAYQDGYESFHDVTGLQPTATRPLTLITDNLFCNGFEDGSNFCRPN